MKQSRLPWSSPSHCWFSSTFQSWCWCSIPSMPPVLAVVGRAFTFIGTSSYTRRREIWHALTNTMIIAVAATSVSVVFGTTAALALHRYQTVLQRFHYTLIYTPLVVPEILMGISLLLFFAAIGMELGLFTIFSGPCNLLHQLRRHGDPGAAAGFRLRHH